ncbi:MAG TPA: 50S ribosomal protein L6 [Synergistaceae bacterium]|jgi:large subunit ribosomal protein L6|nr:50S ribosomal protein L6 [Synergistaceae bacterium]HQF90937.1 50S ribosomal protein L6 [Synergistaceae bacterium]HQH78572.1 50S ribosomal protein L6 [Synergistaceae bacterium]HQK24267.1 50S ribosomal protein L6 [Synergistaceae bacterium]
MSRIGRKAISIPKGVTVNVDGARVVVKGSKGELSMDILPQVGVQVAGDVATVSRVDDLKTSRALHGMTRAMISNMVHGVSSGFERVLEIVGVGYRAQMKGKTLVLNLGYSHPIEFDPPTGIEIATDGPTKIFVRGIDKQAVGQVAANIREFRAPEPYKGKGIRYAGEVIIRKAGKTGSK